MTAQIYATPAEERAVKRFLAAKIRESMNRIEKHPPHGRQILCLREALEPGSIAPMPRFRLSPTPAICSGISLAAANATSTSWTSRSAGKSMRSSNASIATAAAQSTKSQNQGPTTAVSP